MTNTRWLLNKKFWVPREHAEEVQRILLNVPDFGFDFVLQKSKIRRKFHKNAEFVAFFINFNGGIDHYEVKKDEVDAAYREFSFEDEFEVEYQILLDLFKKDS